MLKRKTVDPNASICKVTAGTARMLCLLLLSAVYLAVIHFQESFSNLPPEDEQSYRYVSVVMCVARVLLISIETIIDHLPKCHRLKTITTNTKNNEIIMRRHHLSCVQ